MRHDVKEVVERLKPELNSKVAQARSQALHTLSKIGDKANYPLITLEHYLDDVDKVAVTAWRTASVLVPESERLTLTKILLTQLGRGDSDMQFDLTRFLCALGECIVEPLQEAAKSDKEVIRIHAEFTLIRFQEMQLDIAKKD
jgi:hypothetical protein